MTRCSSAGNIFLFGEHAVVYGKPGIITSIELRAECKIRVIAQRKIKIFSRELGRASFYKRKVGEENLFVLLDLIGDLLFKFGIRKGIELEISSNIPVASGMSSSSAVLCAILGCFSKLFGLKIKKEEYYKYLIKYQRIIHGGKASGSEIISSSQGGFNYIAFRPRLEIKRLGQFPFHIVIGDTGIKTKTSKTVKEFVPKLIKKQPTFVRRCFCQIEKLTKEALKAISDQNIVKIGKLMNKNQEVLADLGLSHPKLDLGIRAAIEAGAYGAKLSGKGQGGVMVALVDDKSKGRIARAIKKAGLEVIQTKIGVEGIK